MRSLFVISFLFVTWFSSAQNFRVEKAKFNTEYDEYCAGLLKDGVIFSSNRKPEVLRTYLDEDDNYYTNLYVAKEKNDKGKSQEEVFSQEISSVLNEGSLSFEPNKKAFWYTSNIFSEDKKIGPSDEFKLGIFKAQKKNGLWVRTDSFPVNSYKQKYNVAHPAISPDGKFMVFSSDMEGGNGSSDLWIIYRENGEWGAPMPLPKGINTEENELFPFIDRNGVLYFSSNGIEFGMGLDVYTTKLFTPLEYEEPVRMRAPINTEFDDYAFLIREDGETGYFSSNRENANDDVYSFEYTYPDFTGCYESYMPYMCYLIEETNLTFIDTLPFAYIWDFGDGNSAEGFKQEHCYADTGFYNITLNIIDTLSGVTYATINDMELLIEQPNQPYISSPDTLIMNEEGLFSSLESEFSGFEVQEWFWKMGPYERRRGEEIYYKFKKPGVHEVQLGALSVPDESGNQEKICVYKEILVVENELELEILRDLASKEEEEIVLDYDYMEETLVESGHPEDVMSEELVESTYYVEVTESDEPIMLDDPYFDKIHHEITERYMEDDSVYVYSVGQAKEVFALWDMYKEVIDSGYVSAIVKQDRIASFKKETEKVGYHYPEEEREEWNRTITEFANIQFDNNSSRIKEESLGSLDYIATMLTIEEEFKLKIDAYTDSRGNDDYNKGLSERRAESVKKYLLRKGIAANRLFSQGHGEENPKYTNETELGRAKNRRVEIEILTVLFKNQIE